MQLKPELLTQLSPERRSNLLKRSSEDIGQVHERVAVILADVRNQGDAANLAELSALKSGLSSHDLLVSPAEIDAAYKSTDKALLEHLKSAARNIRAFHEAQREHALWQMEIAPGIFAGRKYTPLERVGCYVPGMRAAYPSTALMTILPAVAAGVRQIAVCTPPAEGLNINPLTLAACHLAGAHEIYKLGGPWAVASLAYGTPTIAKVDKIVGPGNKYVTAAKMMVYGQVDIDSPAGPSEALIIADDTANPTWLAYDFLAQVEHDPDSAAVLVTNSAQLAEKVCAEISRLLPALPRSEILEKAGRYCAVLVVKNLKQAAAFSNQYAPEHLQIVTSEPFVLMQEISNAGSIFLGPYAPVAVGDYASGTNHVLPTAQGARMFSGLSVDDFIKKPTFQYLTREGLQSLAPTVTALAESEGLFIHSLSVKARLENK